MNEKVLKTLEYNKIIAMLTELAGSEPGKELCRNLVPSSDYHAIVTAQQETDDAVTRVRQKGSLPFAGIHDIRSSLKRLDIGSSLSISELLSISSLLTISARAKSYGRHEENEEIPDDSLDERFRTLEPLTNINTEIKRCILSEDEVSDDASSGLHKVRRQIHGIQDKIHTQLNALLNSNRTYLQDPVITQRDGCYCLPIKAEYKNQVPGVVHDQSSTGSTLFIEPMAVIRLNNERRELEIQEQKEIEAVLADLSNQLIPFQEELLTDYNVLAELDFIFAKSALSRKFHCTRPVFNENGYISLKDARHPLLDSSRVVPITLSLGGEFDLLIVTGPNTGGKTVSLKTTGLLTLMGQAGLQIPAFDGSQLAVFDQVFADIGDEQSIEQNLSTFSSHMTNTVQILSQAGPRSLCLFDELGAGTDPTEGAALAIAILSFLHNMKCRAMATTHYSELKIFALTTPGVENACCEFSVETLQPTYRLLIGIPGKSNAFAISRKLGLPEYIIEDAKTHLEAKDVTFEDLLAHLEENRVTIEKEREDIQNYKAEISRLKSGLERKEEHFDEQKDKMIRKAREEAQQILRDAKETADQTIRQINKLADGAGISKELETERTRLREHLKEVESGMGTQSAKPHKELEASSVHIGDGVRVLSMNLNGTIGSLPNQKGEVYVQMGILRSLLPLKDLELITEATITGPSLNQSKKPGKGKSQFTNTKSFSISPEINLIGKNVDEAISLLDKYLDDARLSHLPEVRIVHGRGTGALRKGIHKYLKTLKDINSFRLGQYGEGGEGVTVVSFRS